jgi:hypothetical protein
VSPVGAVSDTRKHISETSLGIFGSNGFSWRHICRPALKVVNSGYGRVYVGKRTDGHFNPH